MLPKIIVIDGIFKRHQIFRAAFKDQADIYTTNNSNEVLDPSGMRVDIKQVDIMLIHAGDHHLKNLVPAHPRIWYSGGGGIGNRIPVENHHELRFNRAINSQEDFRPQEAQKIIAHYQQNIQLPDFLFDPTNTIENEIAKIKRHFIQQEQINLDELRRHASVYPRLLDVWNIYEPQIRITLNAEGFISDKSAMRKALNAFIEKAEQLK